MLTTIKGYYDHGKIVLSENPQVENRSEVLVTFLTDEKKGTEEKRTLGLLTGQISIPDNFNDELEDFNEIN